MICVTIFIHYWAVGTIYCEGVRGYETESMLIMNVPVGRVEKRVILVDVSNVP